MPLKLSLRLFTASLLLVALVASVRADHINSYQAQHLLQWDQRRDFFDSWLDAKQRNGEQLFRGLLDSHTETAGNYRVTKQVPATYLTLNQLNQRWLRLAISAYQRHDWVDAAHSLSQLQQPFSPLITRSAALLQQATAIRLRQPEHTAATAALSPTGEMQALAKLLQFNQVLTLINRSQYADALPLLEQLQQLESGQNRLHQRIDLLHSFVLANTGDIELARKTLQAVPPERANSALRQPIEALIQRNSGEPGAAVNTLLALHQQSAKPTVNAANVMLLSQLRKLNAQTQSALHAGQLLLPLQQQYMQMRTQVQQVTSAAFIQQLAKRHSGAAPTSLTRLFSKEARLLLVEVERINSLLSQVRAQQPLLERQIRLFNLGLDSIKSLKSQNKALLPTGSVLPTNVDNAAPSVRELESRLSMLVGQPNPWNHRYTLLDGLAVWQTDDPFQNPWWTAETINPESGSEPGTKPTTKIHYRSTDQFDLAAATQELASLQAELISKTALLEEIRIEEELPKLPVLAQRLQAMESQLGRQRQRLLAALTDTLQFEPALMVAKLEQRLLWLSVQTVPHAPQFDRPEQQRWFGPKTGASTADASIAQAQAPREDKPLPPYDFALSALQALADNALNASIQNQAIHHLADLKLLLSERIINGDPIPPRADLRPASAIALYQQLLQQQDPTINRQQVLYQLSKAYEFEGRPDLMLSSLQQLAATQPDQPLLAEVQFRIAELQFNQKQFDLAELSYRQVLAAQTAADFHPQARYKLAWSAFKQGEYADALQNFFVLVDASLPANADQTQPAASQGALIDDTLRVIALTFAYMEGSHSLQQHFDRVDPRPYEVQIYRNLAGYFDYKHRYNDAATTYDLMVQRFPNDPLAPMHQSRVIAAYTQGGFPSKAWPAREQFIARFGIDSTAWQQADEAQRNRIRPYLAGYLIELAQRDHALAQQARAKTAEQPGTNDVLIISGASTAAAIDSQGGSQTDTRQIAATHYHKALTWYDQFIRALPLHQRLPELIFLKAEALVETDRLPEAASLYKQVTYQYPDYARSREAGYAALLAYQSLYKQAPLNSPEADRWLQKGIDESLLLSDSFPKSKYSARIRTKLAEDLLIQNESLKAIEAASSQLLMADLGIPYQLRLWRVLGHAQFDTRQYASAEHSYQQLLQFDLSEEEQAKIRRRIPEAIYQQGEAAQHSGDLIAALEHFQRIGQQAPEAHVLPQAEFDAATLLLKLERWPEAVTALEQFRSKRAGNKLQATINEKLVVAYEHTGNWSKAASALQRIFEREGSSELGRDALWRSAALEEKAGLPGRAIIGYQRFIETFPTPHEPAMEARLKLLQLAQQLNDSRSQQHWLQAIVVVEKQAGSASTDRTLTIASNASLTLGKQAMSSFLMLPLTLPLDQSLPLKQEAMKTGIRHLTQVSNFGLSKPTTEATSLIGRLYREFAQSLMASQRPDNLNALELEQYEILLEEQALPFEDQSIELHEINVSQIGQGIYTPAVETSLNELRQLLPARYGKQERVPGYSDAID